MFRGYDPDFKYKSTGCYRMTAKKFELSTHSRMPHMSCKICHFFRDTGTFEYYVSKKLQYLTQKISEGEGNRPQK